MQNISKQNVKSFRTLQRGCFPIQFPVSFYREILTVDPELTKVYYENNRLVAGISCKIIAKGIVCIRTLAVDIKYRRKGIGSYLVHAILDVCMQNSIHELMLHVQVDNSDAIAFYQGLKFKVRERIDFYYIGIHNPHCFVMVQEINTLQSS